MQAQHIYDTWYQYKNRKEKNPLINLYRGNVSWETATALGSRNLVDVLLQEHIAVDRACESRVQLPSIFRFAVEMIAIH